MGEESEAEQSFFKKHWEGYKEFWGERFSFLQNHSKIMDIAERTPSWSTSDVDEFAASDPDQGMQASIRYCFDRKCHWRDIICSLCLEIFKEFAWYLLPNLFLVAFGQKTWNVIKKRVQLLIEAYDFGAGLSFLAGGVFGWTFGQEIASHWLQLYRMDPLTAQVKFFEWWEKKNERKF